jgi:hypothetical protein
MLPVWGGGERVGLSDLQRPREQETRIEKDVRARIVFFFEIAAQSAQARTARVAR